MKIDLTVQELEIVSRALANVHPTKMIPVPLEVIELKSKIDLAIRTEEGKEHVDFSE